MSGLFNTIQPQDWKRESKSFGTDQCELFRIRYKGSEVAAHYTNSTTAFTFEQGASTAAAAVTTGTNPGTAGVVTPATPDATYHQLIRQINQEGAPDWEAWLEGALPDDLVHSAATLDADPLTDVDCTGANGGAVLLDNTVADYFCAGLTFNGPDTEPHNSDSQVLHELLQVRATLGSAGSVTGNTLVIHECDDIAGTSVAILTVTALGTAATERAYPTNDGIGEPIASVNTKRLVAKLTATGITDHASDNIYLLGRSYAFGPAVRKSKMISAY